MRSIKSWYSLPILGLGSLAFAGAASAQSFNQAIVFGDSSVDSGFYKALPNPGGGTNFNNDWALAVANGAGKPTTSPGGMVSEVLASRFGLTANPANQPGGTNYATSGAKNVTVNNNATGGFQQAIPTTVQIANYLAANGGHANANGIYLISSGANDVSFALQDTGTGPWPANPNQYLTGAAASLANSAASLQAAGARYFVVPDLPYSFGNADQQTARLLYSQTLWSDLAADGVNFVPADINSVRKAIAASPSSFGFTSISNLDPACKFNAASGAQPVTSASALLCSSNPKAPYTFAPGTDQTHLFADEQHLTTAGQKIMADYMYSLVIAPAEISLLPENAVKVRTRSIGDIRNQIDASQQHRGPAGINAWVSGDVAALKIENPSAGFSSSSGDAAAATAGVDYRWGSGLITGGVISTGRVKSDFSAGGSFTQHEVAGSLYAGYDRGPLWGNVIGTYGSLDYDVNRLATVGITTQTNNGSTDGRNLSASLEGGYRFTAYSLTHGPVAGVTWQRAEVDGFTESGSAFTNLKFGDQTRESVISELGYRVSANLGILRPFAQAVWNHEFDSGERQVSASLTTVSFAPAYHMPAVAIGQDWGTVQAGAALKLAPDVTLLGAFTSEFAEHNANNYGGQIGINVAF
jgi:outer membrane lipase/esterase